jgi:hypothetical protein
MGCDIARGPHFACHRARLPVRRLSANVVFRDPDNMQLELMWVKFG